MDELFAELRGLLTRMEQNSEVSEWNHDDPNLLTACGEQLEYLSDCWVPFHPDQPYLWGDAVTKFLKRGHKADPTEYRDVWIPYLEGFPQLWQRPLEWCDSFEELADWVELAPFAGFGLTCSSEVLMATLESPYTANVQMLSVYHSDPGGEALLALAASDRMTRLEALTLASDPQSLSHQIGQKSTLALAHSPALTGLRGLTIEVPDKDALEGFYALFQSPHIKQLRTLQLVHNNGAETDWDRIANGPVCANIERLHYWGSADGGGATGRVVKAFANATHSFQLHTLGLHNWLDDTVDYATALAESPRFSQLKALILGYGSVDLEPFASSPNVEQLEFFVSEDVDSPIFALLASSRARQLKQIHINGGMTMDVAEAIQSAEAEWEQLESLVCLHTIDGISESEDNEEFELLADAPCLQHLRSLVLDLYLEDAGAIALANSPYFPSLRSLRTPMGELGDEGAKAIAKLPYMRPFEATCLHLNISQLGIEGAEALAQSALFENAPSVFLFCEEEITGKDEVVLALASSPHLGAISSFELLNIELQPDTNAALAQLETLPQRVRKQFARG